MSSLVVVTKAESSRKVTFKTTLEEEKNRTAKGIQWRETRKQAKVRRMQKAKMDERERKDDLMRRVYDSLLEGSERLQRAVNESEQLSNLQQTDNEDYNTAATNAYDFLHQWRGLCLMWKVAQDRTALQKLDDFRQKYAGITMDQALLDDNGLRDTRRFRSLEIFAQNGVTKSYLGIWRRAGNPVDGDDTTSGEDLRCNSSIFRQIFRRLPSDAGGVIADHVDRELLLMMPKSSGDDGAPPTAAAAAAAVRGVGPNPPQGAAIQAFDAEEDKPEASDTYKKRNQGDDKKIPTTTTTSNTSNPRKRQKGPGNADN